MLPGVSLDGVRLLSRAAVDVMTRDQTGAMTDIPRRSVALAGMGGWAGGSSQPTKRATLEIRPRGRSAMGAQPAR